ncbi:MAG TPA: hypothetical protein VGY66_29135 [Gemmataceae bacterium]|jgi:hypothetical protein|nr:hypothetical protein [Gemmataceae bacterium]
MRQPSKGVEKEGVSRMIGRYQRFGAFVSFVLAGFDRLRFRGESRPLNNARGLDSYLYQEKIRYVDFRDHCQALTARLREQSERLAQKHGVPIKHLNSPNTDKEATARILAAAQPCSHPMGQIALLPACPATAIPRPRRSWISSTSMPGASRWAQGRS